MHDVTGHIDLANIARRVTPFEHEPPFDADRLQEVCVVTDDQKRAVIGQKRCFDRSNRGEIQVIGRLVQDQQLRRRGGTGSAPGPHARR